MSWIEYRMYWAHASQPDNYRAIREMIMPLTSDLGQGILVLNYGEYSRVRIDIQSYEREEFENTFDRMEEEGILLRWEFEEWNPERDARDRVNHAREVIERGGSVRWRTRFGDREIRLRPNMWETGVPDDELMARFETILTKIVGRLTAVFMESFDAPPSSEWLTSVLIHLFLNSIGCTGPDQGFEPATRMTPPL